MKSQTNLTFAKFRKFLLVTALVISPFLALQNGNAIGTATATLTSGGINSISIMAGGTFTLTLGVNCTDITNGYTVFLQSNDGSGFFTLSNRVNLNALFPDATSANPFPNMAAATLSPTNQFDLGYTGDTINNQPAGTFQLASYTVTVGAGLIPGVYHIFLDPRSAMSNTAFQDVFMGQGNGSVSPIFTITVIPEPTTVGLAIVGGTMLLLAVRRKQRA